MLGHKGRCRFPHGHNYVVWVTVETPSLNHLGMVIDFGDLKHLVGSWIDQHWDHAFLVNPDDDEMQDALHLVRDAKVYIMPEEYPNPTAENMARLLSDIAQTAFYEHGIEANVSEVKVEETENGVATGTFFGGGVR